MSASIIDGRLGKPLAFSMGFHAALMLLLLLSPRNGRRMVSVEKIIPVNLVELAPPEPPRPAEPEPQRREEPPPAPREKPAPAPPARTVARPRPRDVQVPDLVAKIQAPVLAEDSLKQKVQTRLKRPAATPPEMKTPAPKTAAPQPAPARPPEASPLEPAPPRPQPGAEVTVAKGVPAAALTLETANFPHAWYVGMVQNLIYENWTPPGRLLMITPAAPPSVKFRISRNGGVSALAIQQSSGYTLLDRSALEAVRKVGVLPPLPADYREEYLNVVVFFHPILG